MFRLECGRRVKGDRLSPGQLSPGAGDTPFHPVPCPVQPLVERGPRSRHVKGGEELAPVQIERIFVAPHSQGLFEVGQVGPQRIGSQPNLLVPASHDDAVPEGFPEDVEGVPERVPCSILVQVRPQHRKQGVAAKESHPAFAGEVGQQRGALGSGEQGAGAGPIGALDLQSSECQQADSWRRGRKSDSSRSEMKVSGLGSADGQRTAPE
jgi:hypothetical protein